jgi:hypothetical protein
MHPSGVQFGLSRGLLQLLGEEVLLSDKLLETISLQAQMHLQLGRPAIRGNLLVDITVRAAQDALENQSCSTIISAVPNKVLFFDFSKFDRTELRGIMTRRKKGSKPRMQGRLRAKMFECVSRRIGGWATSIRGSLPGDDRSPSVQRRATTVRKLWPGDPDLSRWR